MLIDTSAIISYFNQGETNHRDIVKISAGILRRGEVWEILDTVLEETLAVYRKRISKKESVRVARSLLARKVVKITSLNIEEVKDSVKLFVKHRGKYSYVDCSLVSWAKLHSEKTIFAVDKHFSKLGLKVIP